MRFAHTTCPANWTLPSHTSLFTGLYPARHGVREEEQALDPAVPDLVESLKAAGFATAAFTGGGFLGKKYRLDRGFDEYKCAGLTRAWETTLSDAKRWLVKHHDQDVFLFLHTYEIHAPYASPPRYLRRFRPSHRSEFHGTVDQIHRLALRGNLDEQELKTVRAFYDAGIAYTDDLLGQFLAWLDEQKLSDNLLLIVASDHGEELWEHGDHGHNQDHLGDEVTDVPLIVRLPKLDDAPAKGNVVEGEVSFMDVMPTVLDAVGLDRPAGIDGFSLMPELAGWNPDPADARARARRRLDAPGGDGRVGLTEGRHFVAAQSGRWKTVTALPGAAPLEHEGWPALYDLSQDAAELKPQPPVGPAAKALQAAVDTLVGTPAAAAADTSGSVIDEETRRQLEALGYL